MASPNYVIPFLENNKPFDTTKLDIGQKARTETFKIYGPSLFFHLDANQAGAVTAKLYVSNVENENKDNWLLFKAILSTDAVEDKYVICPYAYGFIEVEGGKGSLTVVATENPTQTLNAGSGSSPTLGQATSAQSTSVVLSSDHQALSVIAGVGFGKTKAITIPAYTATETTFNLTLAGTKQLIFTNLSDVIIFITFPQEYSVGETAEWFPLLPRQTFPFNVNPGIVTNFKYKTDASYTSTTSFYVRMEG